MKKLIALLTAALLALGVAAFAETYRSDDITFEYDEANLEVTHEAQEDDEETVILGFRNKAWGEGYIRIQFQELPDDEIGSYYPTWEEIAENLGTEALENLKTWGNYTDVITASITTDDVTETVFIAPVFDDKNHADMLTVTIGTTELKDEAAATARDDAISAVVDSLKVKD